MLGSNHNGKRRGKALLRLAAAGSVCAAAVIVGQPVAGAATAPAVIYTKLKLINGWSNYGSGTASAAVTSISGIVHFRGAIQTQGTNTEPFVLPVGFRPAVTVYVPVDLCNANNGRLQIEPSGAVFVEQENAGFSDAACFTSLDGASFAKSSASFTTLMLRNGWTKYGFGTGKPGVRLISGIVHFRGAIRTHGTNDVPFVLPAGFRPAVAVYVPVDLCDANNGRLLIEPSGAVFVEQEKAGFSDASCFTSLEGVSFAK